MFIYSLLCFQKRNLKPCMKILTMKYKRTFKFEYIRAKKKIESVGDVGTQSADKFAILVEMGHTLDLSFQVTCKEKQHIMSYIIHSTHNLKII